MRRLLPFSALIFAVAMHPSVGCASAERVASGPGLDDAGGESGFDIPGGSCAEACTIGPCIGGACCPRAQACADRCCGGGEICSFDRCVAPGAECTDSTECGNGEYCELSNTRAAAPDAGVDAPAEAGACGPTVNAPRGRCLPRPPICKEGEPAGVRCLARCELRPARTFDPELKYAWGGQTTAPFASDVMMTPLVVQLDDDNCDGKINADDVPEIVFTTFRNGKYQRAGTLYAVSVKDGKLVEKLAVPDVIQAGSNLAAGDLDGDGVPEIVGCGDTGSDASGTGTVVALRANGSTFWRQSDTARAPCTYEAAAIGDVDGDGSPEVLIGFTLLDGKTGAIKKVLGGPYGGPLITSLVDLDGDGRLDVTDGLRAFRADGTPLWDLSATITGSTFHAVGDFDRDGKPELALIARTNHTMALIRPDPSRPEGVTILRQGIDINRGISTASFCGTSSEYGGGPPTIADFDGDGVPDVGAAGAVGYVVLSGKKLIDPAVAPSDTILWFKETRDCSSAMTGSSVFDFDGDGRAEVVYGDEHNLWMYDGATGENLIPSICNTNGTLWEYPVIADVDGDGQADIVVGSNAYAFGCPGGGPGTSGIRIFSSKSRQWVRTRRIWNQHTYHVTNVNDDGTIPRNETPNWKVPGLNNFRQNKQPGSEFAAPDAVVSIAPTCDAEYALEATVRNLGEAAIPAGVLVGFYQGAVGSGTKIGEARTTTTLYPAQSEVLRLVITDPAVRASLEQVHAIVDDETPRALRECRSDNNASPARSASCGPS
jgi:hypothetical protein